MTSMQDALTEALEHPIPQLHKPHGKHRRAKTSSAASATVSKTSELKQWWPVLVGAVGIAGYFALNRRRE
jgi:hypothetical protein